MLTPEEENAIDLELRAVPVPLELAASLRSIARWPEPELDRHLLEVPVPSVLRERLRLIPSDAELDDEVRNVETPEELPILLRAVSSESAGSQASERPTPTNETSIPSFSGRSWRRVLSATPRENWRAALLVLIATAGYFTLTYNLINTVRRGPGARPELVLSSPEPLELLGELTPSDATPFHWEHPSAADAAEPLVVTPTAPTVALNDPMDVVPSPSSASVAGSGSSPEEVHGLLRRMRLNIFGAAPQRGSELPRLESVVGPQAQGIPAPLLPGYDRHFLLRTGIHPPMEVKAKSELNTCLVPLHVSTTSYDRFRWQAQQGLPAKARDELRVEDALAAMRSGLASPAAGQLAWQVADCESPAGVSRAGKSSLRQLAIAIRAGQPAKRKFASTHLIVAIDLSSTMIRRGTWPWLRSAMLDFAGRLGANDRLTVLLVQQQSFFRSPPIARDSLPLLANFLPQALPELEPEPGFALEAALESALTAITPALHKRVVYLTDGGFDLPLEAETQLPRLQEQLTAWKLSVAVFDPSARDSTAPFSPSVRQLARAFHTEPRGVRDRLSLVHGLQEELYGDASLLAQEVRLTTRFRESQITAYRLMGHEANPLAMFTPPSLDISLYPGDEVHAVLEVLPRAPQSTPWADLELNWFDVTTSKPRSLKQTYRSANDPSWQVAPFWLRQAILAAELAEESRGARYQLDDLGWPVEPVGLARLARLTRELSGYGAESPSFAELLEVVDRCALLAK